ncbi:MAG: EI24 domain-containing protein [Pseudomonadota bacterium]|nr:EI24 domain-containing protein [Pseudomonadota bacterium]
MRAVFLSWRRAVRAQFGRKMLLLSALPLIMSVVLWGAALFFGLQPLIDSVQTIFTDYGWFDASAGVMNSFGLGMLKTLVVPLVAMLLLLPLMICTSLLFMGVAAMPAIGRHVGQHHFPDLEKKHGGSLLGSVGVNLSAVVVFCVLWLLTLPLYFVAPLALLVHALLWGVLTARVMSYDALADYASPDERRALRQRHRRALLFIGTVSGAAGALPGVAWVGGALLSVVLFPLLAILSLWLYLVIFIFTGLWFQYYCLHALAVLRAENPDVVFLRK